MRVPTLAAAALALLAACASDPAGPVYPADPPDSVHAARPAVVHRPADYDPAHAYPLVIVLHGYGVSGSLQDAFFRTSMLVDELDYLLVLPDGTRDAEGRRYWNATEACCASLGEDPPDDVAYVRELVEEVSASHHVDPDRVFLYGHSNGGFMSFRLACEAPDVFAAIAPLAGATFLDPADCAPGTPPVSVLAIHGTADESILYEGSSAGGGIAIAGDYPSANDSLRTHAALAGCDTTMLTEDAPIDFDVSIDGDETTVERYGPGCVAGTAYELWSIEGGAHIPGMNADSTRRVLEWLFAHGR